MGSSSGTGEVRGKERKGAGREVGEYKKVDQGIVSTGAPRSADRLFNGPT